jgi:hypothetical protein
MDAIAEHGRANADRWTRSASAGGACREAPLDIVAPDQIAAADPTRREITARHQPEDGRRGHA